MMTIENIMSKPILKADTDATLDEVVKIMVENNIGSVLIGKDAEALGIITERDLVVKAFYEGLDIKKTRAREIMNSPFCKWIYICLLWNRLKKWPAARLIIYLLLILVTDEEGPVGILSARDTAYYASAI